MSNRPRISRLTWDEWNLAHIAKHGVTPDEAEEVIAGQAMFQTSYKQRLAATGPTSAGRMLTIVIGEAPHQPGDFYVFSARPASRAERTQYLQQKGVSS